MVALQCTLLAAQRGQANLTVDAAISNLTDPNQLTRWNAARALREMGERAGVSVPALVNAIGADASVDVRVEAVLALGSIGKGSPAAVEALAKIVPKRDTVISAWAVIALGDSGIGAKEAVPTIVKYLESATGSEEVIVATITLGRIGPAARQAVPTLEKHLSDTRVVPEWGDIAREARKALDLILKNDRRDQTELSAGGS